MLTSPYRMILCLAAFLFFGVFAVGQDTKGGSNKFYLRGMEASIGVRAFTLESQVAELSGLDVVKSGGSFGFILGNDKFRIPVRLIGLYYGSIKDERTVDILESGIDFHWTFYKFPRTKFELYTIGGLGYSQSRFLGNYLPPLRNPNRLAATAKEPFIGRIDQVLIPLGMGIQYRFTFHKNFLYFFAEGTKGIKLIHQENSELLSNTQVGQQMALNLGFRVGVIQ